MGLIDAAKKVVIGCDVGITRRQKTHEDAVLGLHSTCTFGGRLAPIALFAVADGMGGHARGQVASHLATHSLMQNVLPTVQNGDELSEKLLVDTMVDCVHWANQAIFKYREEHDVDLGTTLTAAQVVESTDSIVNVGDSRTYLYRSGEVPRQITREHSLVSRLEAAGLIVRTPAPSGRSIETHLTEKGAALFERAISRARVAERYVVAALGDETVATLNRDLQRLTDCLAKSVVVTTSRSWDDTP